MKDKIQYPDTPEFDGKAIRDALINDLRVPLAEVQTILHRYTGAVNFNEWSHVLIVGDPQAPAASILLASQGVDGEALIAMIEGAMGNG